MSRRVRAEASGGPVAWTPPAIADDSPTPGEQVILDADELAGGHDFFALDAAGVSMDGNLLAYFTDITDDECCMLRVKDLHAGELLDDEVAGITTGTAWAGSEWTFYQEVDEAWWPDSV